MERRRQSPSRHELQCAEDGCSVLGGHRLQAYPIITAFRSILAIKSIQSPTAEIVQYNMCFDIREPNGSTYPMWPSLKGKPCGERCSQHSSNLALQHSSTRILVHEAFQRSNDHSSGRRRRGIIQILLGKQSPCPKAGGRSYSLGTQSTPSATEGGTTLVPDHDLPLL